MRPVPGAQPRKRADDSGRPDEEQICNEPNRRHRATAPRRSVKIGPQLPAGLALERVEQDARVDGQQTPCNECLRLTKPEQVAATEYELRIQSGARDEKSRKHEPQPG